MPALRNSWNMQPMVPRISTSANSFVYRGTTMEKPPPAIPVINLPTINIATCNAHMKLL